MSTRPRTAPARQWTTVSDVLREKYWVYAGLTMIAVIAHTASTLEVSGPIIAHLARFRDVYIATSVLGFGVLNLRHLRVARGTLPFAVLAGVVAINLVIHREVVYGAMWVLWFLYVAMFYPSSRHLQNLEDFTKYVFWMIVGLVGLVVWVYLFAESSGLETEWAGARSRFTAGLSNPTLLSKLLSTLYWLCLLNFILGRRMWNLALAAVAVFGLFASDVRTDILGVFAGTAVYLMNVLRLRGSKRWLTAASCVAVVFAVTYIDYSVIDRFSSGRWDLWRQLVKDTYASGSYSVYLFGTGNGIIGPFHYDNLYLEILLRYGLVGFAVLVSAVATLLFRMSRQVSAAPTPRVRELASWSVSVLVATSLAGFFATIFPSLGNSINVILLPLAIGVSATLPTGGQ